MKLFGLEIRRSTKSALVPISGDRGAWWHRLFTIHEPFTGAWQRNMELRTETILSFYAVYSCVSLISTDIGKLRIKLVERSEDGIWIEVDRNSPFLPVLRKPNRYLNRIKFIEQWVVSKLLHGNTYVLKERDERGVVTALHVLDPSRTSIMQTPDGSIFYELSRDMLSGVPSAPSGGRVSVPASEIIHDMMVALYHPLCGVSPITACHMAAGLGLNIQQNSISFFGNASRPSGVLSAPGHIGDDTAARLKSYWEENFMGKNAGRVAVLGDALKFEQMQMSAVDAELIKQLEISAKVVCSTFHVPAYKVGVEPPPSYNNIGALNQQYYDQCLHSLIENIELCLDEGLGLTNVNGKTYGTELDVDNLLRMDTATQYDTLGKGIAATLISSNEGRKKIDLPPKKGGDSLYMQQQNYSLEALAERDKQNPLAQPPQSPQPPQVNLTFNGDQRQSHLPAPKSEEEEALEIAANKQFAAWKLDSLLAEEHA